GFASLDEDQIRSIRIPTLLVNGQLSIGLFHCLTDRLEELLPNTERIEIGKASHAMHMDNVTDFNQAVLSFLLKHK
ncbi:MAG: alpha/beta hydrolase, partial [Aliifodinibius sp.]|nr:alpha/beta hydrolase [Fodinibius sp.]NIV15420.1 alpha/beta hydrolase [Fodinibius sp.]NIY29275.1 alpha/beta hydrolase [Fodinibius sp.]